MHKYNSRQKMNLQILENLKQYVLNNPDQRFHQILLNLDVLRRIQIHSGGQNWSYYYVDEAHTEPDVTLGRIFQRLMATEDGHDFN